MSDERPVESINVQADAEVVQGIDAIAAATERSRSDIVNDALRQYLDANSWQANLIREGIAAVREGKTRAAESVFSDIATKHGWNH